MHKNRKFVNFQSNMGSYYGNYERSLSNAIKFVEYFINDIGNFLNVQLMNKDQTRDQSLKQTNEHVSFDE